MCVPRLNVPSQICRPVASRSGLFACAGHPSGPKRPMLVAVISRPLRSMPMCRRYEFFGETLSWPCDGPGQVAQSPLLYRPGPASDDCRCPDCLPVNRAWAGQDQGGGRTYLAWDMNLIGRAGIVEVASPYEYVRDRRHRSLLCRLRTAVRLRGPEGV
jgi:hypothetical protein